MGSITLIIASVISGLILFQSFLVAPAVNKLLERKGASIFLRYIWPKFFLLISLLSLISLLFELYINSSTIIIVFSFIVFILMLVCFIITPLINKAKDNSKKQLWTILHLGTVLITLIVLILNIFKIYLKLSI